MERNVSDSAVKSVILMIVRLLDAYMRVKMLRFQYLNISTRVNK